MHRQAPSRPGTPASPAVLRAEVLPRAAFTLAPALALALALAGACAGSTGSSYASATTARFKSPLPDQPVYGKVSIEVEVETAPEILPLKVEIFVDGRPIGTVLDPPF